MWPAAVPRGCVWLYQSLFRVRRGIPGDFPGLDGLRIEVRDLLLEHPQAGRHSCATGCPARGGPSNPTGRQSNPTVPVLAYASAGLDGLAKSVPEASGRKRESEIVQNLGHTYNPKYFPAPETGCAAKIPVPLRVFPCATESSSASPDLQSTSPQIPTPPRSVQRAIESSRGSQSRGTPHRGFVLMVRVSFP